LCNGRTDSDLDPVEAATERSPGAIREGSYSLNGSTLRVFNETGRLIDTVTVAPDADPTARAKRILREKNEGSGFWAPINYPKQGIV
jgi:hypothetical protein